MSHKMSKLITFNLFDFNQLIMTNLMKLSFSQGVKAFYVVKYKNTIHHFIIFVTDLSHNQCLASILVVKYFDFDCKYRQREGI